MNRVYLSIGIVAGGIISTFIVILTYFSYRRVQKNLHAVSAEDLKPLGNLDPFRREALEKRYKKKFPKSCPVYLVIGPIEYIGFSVHGTESRSYSIGGICIDNKSVKDLTDLYLWAEDEMPHKAEVVFPSINNKNVKGYIIDIDGEKLFLITTSLWSMVNYRESSAPTPVVKMK